MVRILIVQIIVQHTTRQQHSQSDKGEKDQIIIIYQSWALSGQMMVRSALRFFNEASALRTPEKFEWYTLVYVQ